MAARQSWTTALRRRRLRRSTIRRGRASTGSGDPSAQGCTTDGGGRCPSHGDGCGGDASESSRAVLELTEHSQRAWVEAASHEGAGGAAVVVEKRRGQAGVDNGDGGARCGGGGCCGRGRKPRKWKWRVLSPRAGAGSVNGVLAYLCRTGQGTDDARPAAGSTWRLCPDTGRPLNTDSVRQSLRC